MREHGFRLPYHPLQMVAMAVFSAMATSFFVFFAPFAAGRNNVKYALVAIYSLLAIAVFVLYVICTACDPADPGVHEAKLLRKLEAALPKLNSPVSKKNDQGGLIEQESAGQEEPIRSLRACLAVAEVAEGEVTGEKKNCCNPNFKAALKVLKFCRAWKFHEADDSLKPEEQEWFYCRLCDAKISGFSKHCRPCDKCVLGFDHHCRWINNCVGKRNYKAFMALVVMCLLMLVLQWVTGIVVLERYFSNKKSFDKEIVEKLGISFTPVAFAVVVVLLSTLALLSTAPLTQLFCFHLILIHKGLTTYEYIVAVREQDLEGPAGDNLTTSSPSSTRTGFHGALVLQHDLLCTPPQVIEGQNQDVLVLSDLEIGGRRESKGHVKYQQTRVPVGINPWKLAHISTEDAARAAVNARQNSRIISPAGPQPSLNTDTEGSSQSTSGEIKVIGSKRRNHYHLPPEKNWELNSTNLPTATAHITGQFIPKASVVGEHGAVAVSPLPEDPPLEASNSDCSGSDGRRSRVSYGQEARNTYYSGSEGRLSRISYPGSSHSGSPAISAILSPCAHERPSNVSVVLEQDKVQLLHTSSASDILQSPTSDGYEASCGESSDDNGYPACLRLNQPWSKRSLQPAFLTPLGNAHKWMGCQEETVRPWPNLDSRNSKIDARATVRGPGTGVHKFQSKE
ncbi:unnamed protein product [Sphagnum troendelagicum]|uniref:S-acyltransferase n=1 Tax=Sphagnum troendelagicum TaxID=128251 RepID=A0ABP0TVN0_9BRYO